MKDQKKVEQGKKDRKKGKQFEIRVRAHLERMKWIVDRWSNNVDLTSKEFDDAFGKTIGRLVPAKPKFARIKGRFVMLGMQSGFPDFIAFQWHTDNTYSIIGVESKINGKLDAEEKKKAKWLIDNKIFSSIFVAHPVPDGRKTLVKLTLVEMI